MRKYIIGFLVGALVFTAGSAVAKDISLVGKKVGKETEIKLNGESFDKAIIIDGKSYAPVRSIATATGLDVGFKDGVVLLNEREKKPVRNEKYLSSTLDTMRWSLGNKVKMKNNTESKVTSAKQGKEKWQDILDGLADDASDTERQRWVDMVNEAEDAIQEHLKQLASQEQEIADLEKEIAETEAELEALKTKK